MSTLYILLTGKRKSGKDFIACELEKHLNDKNIGTATIHLSSYIKEVYAQKNNLKYEDLISSGPYKEIYRAEMVKWGEEQRKKDPGIFCRYAISTLDPKKNMKVVVVIAARRLTDIDYFINNYGRGKVIILRIFALDDVRRHRGWTYTEGIDDCETELGLDKWSDWDLECPNNNPDEGQSTVLEIVKTVEKLL